MPVTLNLKTVVLETAATVGGFGSDALRAGVSAFSLQPPIVHMTTMVIAITQIRRMLCDCSVFIV
jgi:hypothetical protein